MKNFLLTFYIILAVCFTANGQIVFENAPTGITENNSATFTVSGLINDNLTVNFYNRWGNLIIEKTDLYSGAATQEVDVAIHEFPESGVYIYMVKAGDSIFTGNLYVKYPEDYTIETIGERINDTSSLSINISHLQMYTVSIFVYDITGEPIIKKMEKEIRYGNLECQIENNEFIKDGIYILQVVINDSSTLHKVLVDNTVLSNNTLKISKPQIYPNPFTNEIDFSCFDNMVSIQLVNANGTVLWDGNNIDELGQVVLSLHSGSYLLCTETKNSSNSRFTQWVVKE